MKTLEEQIDDLAGNLTLVEDVNARLEDLILSLVKKRGLTQEEILLVQMLVEDAVVAEHLQPPLDEVSPEENLKKQVDGVLAVLREEQNLRRALQKMVEGVREEREEALKEVERLKDYLRGIDVAVCTALNPSKAPK